MAADVCVMIRWTAEAAAETVSSGSLSPDAEMRNDFPATNYHGLS